MDFFSQYNYYFNFFCGCAYLLFALACFLSWKAKFGRLSYFWMWIFGLSYALIKFFQMSVAGDDVSPGSSYSWIVSWMLYATTIFFFMAAQQTYRKFIPGKLIKYLIIPCALIAVTGTFFGPKYLEVAVFIFLWLPSSLMVMFSILQISKTTPYSAKSIYVIFLLFISYCVVYITAKIVILLGFATSSFIAIFDCVLAIIIFSIATLVFKYFKVTHEKQVRIYEYIPIYWKHIPIGTILFLIMVFGMFFSMYLENYSRGNIERSSQSVATNIAETIQAKLIKSDQGSSIIAQIPGLKEAIINPTPINKFIMNTLFDNFAKIFGTSEVFAVDNSGKIIFYSESVKDAGFLEMNFKHRPYFVTAKNGRHGKVFAKNFADSKQSYYSSNPVYYSKAGIRGVIVVKDNIDDIAEKLSAYKNIYVIDENGIVLLSDKEDIYFNSLWPLFNSDSAKKPESDKKNILSKEVFDKETIYLNNESYYVSRRYINEEGWSVIYFSPLRPVKQFKVFSMLSVFGAILIVILLYWSINQSNRILALALQHKAILNSAKSTAIISMDTQGEIIVYGQGAEDILGYTKNEFQKERFESVFFDRNEKPISFAEAVTYASNLSTEFMCKRKDGTVITILVSVLPQYSVENKLVGYIFSATDITATKEVEVELEQQIKFLQMLIDSMPIAVYYKDSDKNLIGCNKAFEEIMEHSKDFMIGKKSEDIYYDTKAGKKSTETDTQIERSQGSMSYEIVVKFIKSPPQNLIFYKSAYKKIDGKFGGIIGVIVDATKERTMQMERDALQNNLIQQNKLASLGELAGSIAHELNNPLSIILGFAQVLIKDASLTADAKKAVENIYEASKRSKSVITNMLEFARSDTSKTQIVQVNDVIESTMLIIEKDFTKAGIEIEKNLTKERKVIIANPMQVQQVVLNVLLNAKDAMPKGGKINIKTSIKDKYFVITISDNGEGIAQENLSKVFDPFFTTKGIGKGTGLGLSICYGIVKAHKGEISVRSAIGKGTVFNIKFPLDRAE